MLKTLAATACAVLAIGGSASAAVITLDFEGLGNEVSINDFYDGNGGPDYDITFSPNALSIIDQDAGGTGNFANEPTPDTVMFFLQGDEATLNAPNGFEDGFSFFYSAINFTGSIDVYDGVDATGTLLASLDLPRTGRGPGDPQGDFAVFSPIGVPFEGTARSIDFGGTQNQIGFDNITFGSALPGSEGGVDPDIVDMPDIPDTTPIPVPASLPLLAGGLGAVFALRRRRG
ncbi:VPLPA-CTERM sorting domain-containing protein [uncultured Jannaschia sp.]|uniref:VPLPA-CTERM sorting domain-containing protein n=1 Tax=uncultured Jannaschia sp. TaxID=293347 RepID=UPI00261CB60F|nr:VPLPA-CTERM sorting domain-containing protein [uncultured Jannaschia sp.]